MIRTENLCYEIGGRTILNNISIHVEKGETLGVMGMSGVGKSTLLKCVAGLIAPKSGDVFIDGTNIVGMPESKLNTVRRKIGMVFQYAALFDSLNVYRNVSFGLRKHTKMTEAEMADVVDQKLSIVGLKGVEERMPSELSGGMQKRVGLARALAMEPGIVMYDEPTAGLDPITSATIAELIKKTRDELSVTSMLVSHDIQSVMTASDRIAMLHKGEIVAIGTVDEIRSSVNPAVRQFISGSTEGPIQVTR